jgi:hypothetical protein
MRSPGAVFDESGTDKVLIGPGADLATVCADVTGTPLVIVNVRVAVPVPPVFVALSVTVDVPVDVGVPEISPVDVFTEAHPGKPVALKLVGEFVAVI